MYKQRLRHIAIGFAVILSVLVLRLIDLQVVRADYYRERARAALLRPAKIIPFVRGRILDRSGAVLASDEPCWQVSVDYDVLSSPTSERRIGSADTVDAMWKDLSAFGGISLEALRDRAGKIVERISRWHRHVARHLGYDVTIREERMAHPLLTGLDDQKQITARELFARYPWVSVEHGSRRVYDPSPSLGHILGRLGAVGPEDLNHDPHWQDPLARYQATETKGVSGVEFAAERVLRGRRGRWQRNLRGETVRYESARDGRDVVLTLRLDLQRAIYRLLQERIAKPFCPYPSGAAIVVLHVPTRQVLAMVSYPGFDANAWSTRYDEYRADTRYTPLRFRALANAYEPGSIVKPLTCLAGLGAQAITTHTVFRCTGYYLEGVRDRLRCWAIAGTNRRKAHGEVNVVTALSGSCNIFMYHVADLIGVGQLTNYFDMAGFGRSTGIALREERDGINPTPDWLMRYRNAPASLGRAKNFAIGQGEVSITPLQAANLAAVYASGVFKPVTLMRGESPPKPEWQLPVKAADWRAVREGLYRVTNDPAGTAYRVARWRNDRYVLCGKTGSATTPASPTRYVIEYLDADGERKSALIPAKTHRQAVEDFKRQHPLARFDSAKDVRVDAYWPPKSDDPTKSYSHAWFIGYLQPIADDGSPMFEDTAPIALAVMVEFGGSGGYTSGPIAREVARIVCEALGEELDPDANTRGGPA